MLSIVAGLTATKATLDLVKILSDLVDRPGSDPVAVRSKLHELLIHAVSAQSALAEAGMEMTELRQKLDDKEELRQIRADMEHQQDGGFFIRKSERDAGSLIPYCPICWGDSQKMIPLTPHPSHGAYMCALHRAQFTTEEYRIWIKQKN